MNSEDAVAIDSAVLTLIVDGLTEGLRFEVHPHAWYCFWQSLLTSCDFGQSDTLPNAHFILLLARLEDDLWRSKHVPYLTSQPMTGGLC